MIPVSGFTRPFLSACAVSLLLAGCLQGVDSEAKLGGASAAELWGLAAATARSWHEGAYATLALGVESPVESYYGDDPFMPARVPKDYRIGDGRASVWVYEFLAEPSAAGAEGLRVAINADGSVASQKTFAPSSPPAKRLPERRVDSTNAASTLWQKEDLARECLRPQNTTVIWSLENRPEGVFWVAELQQPGLAAGAWLVDAESGESAGPAVRFSCNRPAREASHFEGELNAATPAKTHSFFVNASTHEELGFGLTISSSLVARNLEFDATSPNGTRARLDRPTQAVCAAFNECFRKLVTPQPLDGVWEIRIRLLSGFVAGYHLDVCAVGDPRVAAAAGTPCAAVYRSN